jgi:cell division transport system ATP-binding protein
MVQLIDVFKTYGNGTRALKGVSLKLESGEFAFLVGPSGSGKSTVIKLITAKSRRRTARSSSTLQSGDD